MSYASSTQQLKSLRAQIGEIRKQMRGIQAAIEPQPVNDYVFQTTAGPRALSSYFGDKPDLIVIHNMGRSCPYCTMWADGYNGVYDHLANRAAFLVTSPDAPEVQREFAVSRGWRFPMASHAGSTFAADMGYRSEKGGWMPGISVFRRRDGGLVRVSDAELGPYDDFSPVWHLFDLMPEGAGSWSPRFKYAV